MVENVEYVISVVDRMANTSRKRHIFGGILLSVSLLFCGLTITILTIQSDDCTEMEIERDEDNNE